jgi:hypothetical protein
MSTTLYRDTGAPLIGLIEDIRTGRLALPDIQRPFVWASKKVRDLFDSMYRGYPIGTLMLWETGAEVGTRQIGLEAADRTPQLLIVDGQQRLTSLYAVLTGSSVLTKAFEEKRIRIAFSPVDEVFEVADAAIERNPEFVPDITALWSDGYRSTARQYLRRLGESRPVPLTEAEEDELDDRINRVHDLRDFRFQIVELSSSTDEEQVADIFVRTNSEGVSLNQADFILTLMSVHWEKGRRQLEEFSRAATDPTIRGTTPKNPFIEPSPDQMLRVAVALAFRRARLQFVYNILRGKDLDTGTVSLQRRDLQFAVLAAAQAKVLDLGNWHEFLKCLQTGGFRSRKTISSDNALLFSYALWLVGRIDFGLDLPSLRTVIARWFFMAHTTGRYTSSPESALEFDLGRIADLPTGDGSAFVAELDRLIAANFTSDYWEISLPNRLDTSSSRSPVLFAYLAALNVLDAEVLFSNVRVRALLDPGVNAPRAAERHHLFPKAFLARGGVTNTRQTNAIANMAFLDWAENAKISDQAPSVYWPVMTAGMPEDRLRRQTYLHALPVGWEQLDYPTFLVKRRSLIAKVVRDGFASLQGDHQSSEITPVELIKSGEGQTVEFKSTARVNVHTGQADPRLEHVILKTVCGFLNAEGGTLFVGVDDEGNAVGIDPDLATLGSKANVDGYELFLRQLLETGLSVPTAATVRIRFEPIHNQTVCLVRTSASGRPVFAKPVKGQAGADTSEFWVRIGNQTRQLHGDDMVQYQSDHWG